MSAPDPTTQTLTSPEVLTAQPEPNGQPEDATADRLRDTLRQALIKVEAARSLHTSGIHADSVGLLLVLATLAEDGLVAVK